MPKAYPLNEEFVQDERAADRSPGLACASENPAPVNCSR